MPGDPSSIHRPLRTCNNKALRIKSLPLGFSNRAVACLAGCDEKPVRRWVSVPLATRSAEAGQARPVLVLVSSRHGFGEVAF